MFIIQRWDRVKILNKPTKGNKIALKSNRDISYSNWQRLVWFFNSQKQKYRPYLDKY